jgi:hypothetical protein
MGIRHPLAVLKGAARCAQAATVELHVIFPSLHDQFSPLLYHSIDCLMDGSLPIEPRQVGNAGTVTDIRHV